MSEYSEIGKRIHDIRITRNMMQEELAEKADLSVPWSIFRMIRNNDIRKIV